MINGDLITLDRLGAVWNWRGGVGAGGRTISAFMFSISNQPPPNRNVYHRKRALIIAADDQKVEQILLTSI